MMKEIISIFTSFAIDSATLISKLSNPKEMEIFFKLFQRIYDETKSDKDKDGKNKSNRILYWNFTLEEKLGKFDDIKPIWYKINEEDYQEKGPVQVQKKDEIKKEEKSDENITDEDKKDKKKDEKELLKKEKKDLKKDEKFDKKDGKKDEIKDDNHLSLQAQIDALLKIVTDLKNKVNDNPKLRNIYINNPCALKNWNLSLKNSFEIEGKYVKSICLNYESDTVVFGTKSGLILTYRLNSWDLIDKLSIHKGTVKDIVYLNDSRTIISVGNDGKIVKIDLETKITHVFSKILPAAIKSIAYIRDGMTIYVACQSILYTFDINTGHQLNENIAFNSELLKIIFIKDKKCLSLGFRNGSIKIYSLLTKKIVSEFTGHKSRITDITEMRFNDSNAIATSSKDKTMNIYGIEENSLLKSLKVPATRTNFPSSRIFYGYDDKTLITTHEDGKIILNNYNTGDLQKEQTNKFLCSSAEEKISCAYYCQDGTNFIVATQRGKIEVYGTK